MNIHLSEFIVVVLVALLVIKPEHLPDLAFKIGRVIAWLRRSMKKLKHELDAHD